MGNGNANGFVWTANNQPAPSWNSATRGGGFKSYGQDYNCSYPFNLHNHNSPLQSAQASNGLYHSAPKRPYSTAFSKPTPPIPKPQAAPAVPSFNSGIPLAIPEKGPSIQPSKAEMNKRPRKHNQLGLTPASQDRESSPDGEDEEARLAGRSEPCNLQFEHRGRTSTLRTAAEIATWIAERKKNFPTQAKAEAAKKEAEAKQRKWQEEKKARDEAVKAQREQRERERNEREKERLRKKLEEDLRVKAQAAAQKQKEKEKEEGEEQIVLAAATKAKIKAERLRRRVLKAERELAKAEQAAQEARTRRASVQSAESMKKDNEVNDTATADSSIEIEAQTLDERPVEVHQQEDHPSSEALISTHGLAAVADRVIIKPADVSTNDNLSGSPASTSSSADSDISLSDSSHFSDSDATSSSGSTSDSDASPQRETSKHVTPERILPPHHKSRRPTMCRKLVRTGKCPYGSSCWYSHDIDPAVAEHQKKGKRKQIQQVKKERRKGLFEVMVEKEKEEERRRVLQAIVFLGENGMLGNGIADGNASKG